MTDMKQRIIRLAIFATTAASGVAAAQGVDEIPVGASAALAASGEVFADPDAVEERIDATTYVLGPGDNLVLGMWGEQPSIRPLTVTLEGVLLIREVGEIAVAGKTLAEAGELVEQRLSDAYRNVRITLRLLSVRKFKIPVTGQVVDPGLHVAKALDRVSAIVRRASGFAEGASRRRIVVTNGGVERARADLARFDRLGDSSADPLLESGDHVHVPFVRDVVTVHGAVHLPGAIELVPGDRLSTVLELAGGLFPNAAFDSIEVARFVDDLSPPVRTTVAYADAERFELEESDEVFVRTIGEWREREVASVEGEVAFPGSYPITEGETTLRALVQRAGGPTADASIELATVTRTADGRIADPEFERLKLLSRTEMTDDEYEYVKMRARQRPGLMVVDFSRALLGDEEHDILLEDGDRVEFPRRGEFVSVLGLVSEPGNVTLRRGLDVDDYIELAGGYAERARKGRTRVVRSGTGEWLEPGDVDELRAGDTIWVPEKPDRDFWHIFMTSLGVATQFATLYLLVDRVAN